MGLQTSVMDKARTRVNSGVFAVFDVFGVFCALTTAPGSANAAPKIQRGNFLSFICRHVIKNSLNQIESAEGCSDGLDGKGGTKTTALKRTH